MRRRQPAPPAPPPPPSLAFPENVCLVCGRPARRFTSEDVPELMQFVGGEVAQAALAAAARRRFPDAGCLVAPLAGVSVCATKWMPSEGAP
jgi:hypothetical protein